ncbi:MULTISPECIES: DUF2971 domain-containing protein [Stenotrophomonas]|uniref:DUF2971 domain-containing protein n=1 Tax=Stenotrophomonas TaxID=40323 RepID=UPI0021C6C967|nr:MULTISPECIES: DUF2971 domain-containing protein [Stenotrophomonas]MCU1079896.1 DUF2971 domain-containing protein [Stenotrophomonas maltophilia]
MKFSESDQESGQIEDQHQSAPPSFLYKYRSFNRFLLQELCDSATFFSSPVNFNDPLDSRPTLVNDLETPRAERLLEDLFKERWPTRDVAQELKHCQHMATEHASTLSEREIAYRRELKHQIELVILDWTASRGVLSLASSWSCPLMWSHYADQHMGICLEYATANHVAGSIRQVSYDKPRSIKMSDVAKWRLEADPIARERVIETAFLSKAPAWAYEKEWRVLAKASSSRGAPFDLSAIYFGARCPSAVQTAIVKTMHDVSPKVDMFNVRFSTESFELKKEEVWIDEILQVGIRPSAELVFGRHPIESKSSSDTSRNEFNDGFY